MARKSAEAVGSHAASMPRSIKRRSAFVGYSVTWNVRGAFGDTPRGIGCDDSLPDGPREHRRDRGLDPISGGRGPAGHSVNHRDNIVRPYVAGGQVTDGAVRVGLKAPVVIVA